VRDTGKVVGLDRIAVISALNLANELIRLRRSGSSVDADLGAKLQRLRERVESALEKGQQLHPSGGGVARPPDDLAPPAVFDTVRVTSRP